MVNVSVIVCTYNRAESLRDTLKSLADQRVTDGLNYEVIVVDNNSKDHTPAVVNQWSKISKRPIRYRFEGHQGLSYARNTGIREASGQLLAFTDDDVLASPYWVQSIWNCFRETGALVVAGKIERLWHCERPEWFRDEISGPLICQDLGNTRKKWDSEGRHMVGANMTFHRRVFERFGPFRVELGRRGELLIGGEDREMFQRLFKAGCPIYYEPKAIVSHKVERERLSQAFLRRWFWDVGRTLGHEMKGKYHYAILIAPLWLWKSWFEALRRYLMSPSSEKFIPEMWVRHYGAMLWERFIHWQGRKRCAFFAESG